MYFSDTVKEVSIEYTDCNVDRDANKMCKDMITNFKVETKWRTCASKTRPNITLLQILCEEKRFLPHHESLHTVITDRNLIKAPNPPILIPFGSFIFSSVLIYWAGVPILNHFPCLVQIWTKFRILDLIEATVECGNVYYGRFW